MIKSSKWLINVLLLFTTIFLQAQQEKRIKNNLHLLANQLKDSLSYNGVIMISDNGNPLLKKAFGYSNYEHQIKNNLNTKFRIASVSKMFTSYAIYILADKKLINLNSSIRNFIPSLNKKFKNITVSQLILHTSGLTRSIDNLGGKTNHDSYTNDELISIINSTDLQSVPGRSFSYSNIGFSLLGIIIENTTKKSYGKAMEDLVFTPLGLNNTGHEVEGDVLVNKANGYNMLGKSIYKANHENKSHVFGAGSLFSTANDLLLFSKEVMNGTLLSTQMHEKYLKIVANNRTGGGWVSWGYKAKLEKEKSAGQLIMHGGSSSGFRAVICIFLDHKKIVIGLSNQPPINTSIIYNRFGNVALGLDIEPIHKPIIDDIISHVLNNEHQNALLKYKILKDKYPNKQGIRATDLNSLGYTYLGYNQFKNAVSVFKFASKLFSNDANIFDSYADALFKSGNQKRAIEMYQKSLELNPKNDKAKKIVSKFLNRTKSVKKS
mgnify:CR=1 FL=1